jgi:tetratricopeptide (TPR) repeat protein
MSVSAQYFEKEKALINKVEKAKTDADKINALGDLAEFYYVYRDSKKADSILQKQLLLAEISNDKELIRATLFSEAIDNVNEWSNSETYKKAIVFLDKGLNYAAETGNDDFQAEAHVRKASLYRKKGDHDLALQQITLAFSDIQNTKNDSLKVMVHLEGGNIFLAKGDAVSAYKNYNSAYDVAYGIKNTPLLSKVYHHFADLYQSLNNSELAKQSVLKSFELNKKNKNDDGLLKDYVYLGRITDQKEYVDKVLELAARLNNEQYKLQGKRMLFGYLIAFKKDIPAAFSYLYTNDDLLQSYLNMGKATYYWNIGSLYRYANKVDSAIYYYSLVEPEMKQSFDINVRKSLMKGLADCYLSIGNNPKAIEYYTQAFSIARQQNDYNSLSATSAALSSLYSNSGNYKSAYEYSIQYNNFKDTLNNLAAQRDVVMLEVEREKKRHEKDLADADAHALRVRNLQYMGISIAIAVVLTLLVLTGMFPISTTVVKMSGFVAFICLFEFIILLIDNWLHHLAHGEPLKIWLAKIVIIGILLPLHHYIEHVVVHFLASKRLMKLRDKMSIKNLFPKKKTAPAMAEAE